MSRLRWPFTKSTLAVPPPGPHPFSGEWMQDPATWAEREPAPPPVAPLRSTGMPAGSDRLLVGVVVMALALIVPQVGRNHDLSHASTLAVPAAPDAQPTQPAATEPATSAPPESAAVGGGTDPSSATEPVLVAGAAAEPGGETGELAGALLPQYRILAYYGQPHDADMGILGEYGVDEDLEGLHAALQAQADEYALADPTRPVKLAFEIIATVAQGDPMSDGSWLLSTDAPTIQQYVDYATANDMLVILDVQIGRRGVPEELELVRDWLAYPNVHLALDPEFAMDEGQVPGIDIGRIDASDVRYAQEYLAELSAELGIPPKILIVHQFHDAMIENKDQVAPYPGVQLVIESDGWGSPELKRETYQAIIAQQAIEFNGVKLFYRQDEPLMSARQVLALEPIPDLVIYQ